MAKIRSHRDSDELGFFPPADCSYFEEMCWRAEHETDPESRGHAQYEVDRMVKANNDALEEDRMKSEQSLADFLNDEIGNLFDGIHFGSNDDLTRMSVRSHLDGLMQGLMNARHIQDYKVVCDASNNPNSVIEANDLVVHIAYKDVQGKLFHGSYAKRGFSAAIDITVDDLSIGSNGNSPSNRGYPSINGNGGYVGSAQGAVNGGFVNVSGSGAIGHMVGQISAGGSTYTLTAGQGISFGLPEQKQTADLPSIEWSCKDDTGQLIRMKLEPEGTISASDSLKIMLLLQSSNAFPLAFSPYLYIKKHNLERHFKFSV